jgi:hypothetical protein
MRCPHERRYWSRHSRRKVLISVDEQNYQESTPGAQQ